MSDESSKPSFKVIQRPQSGFAKKPAEALPVVKPPVNDSIAITNTAKPETSVVIPVVQGSNEFSISASQVAVKQVVENKVELNRKTSSPENPSVMH